MNFGEFKERVRRQLGNLPAEHPILVNLGDWVNDAIRDLPQRDIPGGFDRRTLFTELLRKTLVQQVAEQGWILAPENMLAPLELFAFWDEAQPNPDRDRANPVKRTDWEIYETLHKEHGDRWPSLWAWHDERLYIYPTPEADHRAWLYLYYLYEHPDMVDDDQAPLLNKRWHRAVVNLATSYGESAQGHAERAAFFEGECDKQMVKTLDWVGRSEQRDGWAVKIKGDPCWTEVYD